MKNKTLRKLGSFGLVVFGLAVLLTLFGCKECDHECGPICNPQDHTKMQRATIRLFGTTGWNAVAATVEGYMTDAEWAGVADAVKGGLDATYDDENVLSKTNLENLFGRGVIFIVEANPVGYTNFRTTGDGKTIYIALSAIDSLSLLDALWQIYNNTSVIGKVSARDTVRLAKAPIDDNHLIPPLRTLLIRLAATAACVSA